MMSSKPIARLTLAILILAGSIGGVSALTKMFYEPLRFLMPESSFHFEDVVEARAADERLAPTFQETLSRTAPAWLTNALPGYSSGRARELWYLSLDRAGDRSLGLDQLSATNYSAPNSSPVFNVNLLSFSSAPSFVASAAPKTFAPTAVAVSGTENDFFQNADLMAASNYSLGHLPLNTEDVRLTTSVADLTMTTVLSMASLNVTNNTSYTISRAPGAGHGSISLGGGGTTDSIAGSNPVDLIFLGGATSRLTIYGQTASTSNIIIFLGADGNFDVANQGATLEIGAEITGYFNLTKTGNGTLILDNAFSDFGRGNFGPLKTFTLAAGTLDLGASSVVNSGFFSGGPAGAGNLALAGGTIESTDSTARRLANNLMITGNVTFGSTTTETGALTFDAITGITMPPPPTTPITLGGAGNSQRTVTINVPTAFIGEITETNPGTGLVKAGPGTLTLGNGTEANANTYTGTTTVNGGELDLNKPSGTTAIAGNLVIGDDSGTDTVKLLTANQIADSSDVTINGSGVLNLNNHNETIDGLTGTLGSAVTLGSAAFAVGANNESAANFRGVISGTGQFVKTGTGTQILSGTNTYSGNTEIRSGDLRFDLGGSSNNSTILLGGGGNNATLSLGVGNGNNVASPLMALLGSGVNVLRSVATTGTNTYSGPITLTGNLTLEAISNGSISRSTLLLEGGSIDVTTKTLTVDTQLDQNGADSVNAQGTVIINELLGSSSPTGGSLVKDGSNTLILEGVNNTYTGAFMSGVSSNTQGTRIAGGVLGIYGDGSLGLAPGVPVNNIFFTASSLSSSPSTPTLQATSGNIILATTRNIDVANGVTAQFDSNGNTFTIPGVINGGGNVTKIGLGTLALTGANTYTGTTTINNGSLNAAAANALGSTSSITVNSGGTLLFGNNGTIDRINNNAGITLNGNGSATPSINTAGLSEYVVGSVHPGMGALTLQSSSIIDLGNGASILAFSNSALQAANWNGTLSIYNWSGNFLTGNGTDQLYFGTDATGLAPSQLLQISFYSDNGSTFLGVGSWGTDLDGEVVPLAPVPEPSTWIGAMLALGVIGFTQRRKLRR